MAMNRIWANRLEAGTKTWAECPDTRKEAVDAILRQDVENGKITAERYTEIVGFMRSIKELEHGQK